MKGIHDNSSTQCCCSFLEHRDRRVVQDHGRVQCHPERNISNFSTSRETRFGIIAHLLPTDLAQSIFDEVGATVVLGYVVVPCSLAQKNGTINYAFGGPSGVTIKVPLSSLISSVPPKPRLCLADHQHTQTANSPASSAFRARLDVVQSLETHSCVMLTSSTTW